MITVPPRPRLRASFFYQNGELFAELVLMNENRELVSRTMQAVPSPHPLETIQRALLVLIAPPPAPELEPEASPALELVSAEEREAARAAQLARPEPEPATTLELEPEAEPVPELVSTEEREAARAAQLARPEAQVVTPEDVGNLATVLELQHESTEDREAMRATQLRERATVENTEPEPAPTTQRERE